MFDRLKRLFRIGATTPPQPQPLQPSTTPNLSSSPTASTNLPQHHGGTQLLHKGPPPPAGSITISLRSVLLKLPDTLKGKVRQPPGGGVRIAVPLQQVLPQLPQGSVKISFGDIRKASPPGVFSDTADRDHTLVELPLQEILNQLKPDQLPRRTGQKKIDVPDDVSPVFGPNAQSQGNVRLAHPGKFEAPAKPAPTPFSQPKPPAPPPTTSPPPLPCSPGATHKPLPISPSIPLPQPGSLKPSAPPSPIKSAAPLPLPATPKPVPLPTASAPPQPATPQPATPPQPTTPAKEDFIPVPLATVTAGWPEPIRQALAGLNAPDAVINLPASETEQALKRGKVLFPWKRLKPLIRPPLKTALSHALDDLQIELPLSAIAPLFLAQRKSVAPQKKYSVATDIPDVFSPRSSTDQPIPSTPTDAPVQTPAPPAQPKLPTPPPPEPVVTKSPTLAPPAPAHAAPSVTPTPSTPATTAQPTESAPTDIGEVFGQPGRKNWAPAELVQRTATLKGVAGAIIIMQDGLLVASHLPPGLNGEAISAFLPQMFSRVTQYSKELKFGDSNNITITIDHVPLRIYKAGSVFFAALGRHKEPLPEPHLDIIAFHLAPQSK